MATENITITVPVGTKNHGDQNLLCTPTKWTDIIIFYSVNYLAHAVTVKSLPGEQMWDTAVVIFSALVYPYSGLLRGIEAILRRAAWRPKNDLELAVRAGALCTVVRSANWKPKGGQKIRGVEIDILENKAHDKGISGGEKNPSVVEAGLQPKSDEALWRIKLPKQFDIGIADVIFRDDRTVHGIGIQDMPKEYTLAILPSNACIKPDHDDVSIAFNYNVLQAVVSIVQIFSASATLYKTRGDQLREYGYAAFGLTVIPYIIMSIINLLGNCLTPDFATLYLVHSLEMAEAKDRGAKFEGVVGTLLQEPGPHEKYYTFEETKDPAGFIIKEVPTLSQDSTSATGSNINPSPEKGEITTINKESDVIKIHESTAQTPARITDPASFSPESSYRLPIEPGAPGIPGFVTANENFVGGGR